MSGTSWLSINGNYYYDKIIEESCKSLFPGDIEKLERFSLNCDIRCGPGKGNLIIFPTLPVNKFYFVPPPQYERMYGWYNNSKYSLVYKVKLFSSSMPWRDPHEQFGVDPFITFPSYMEKTHIHTYSHIHIYTHFLCVCKYGIHYIVHIFLQLAFYITIYHGHLSMKIQSSIGFSFYFCFDSCMLFHRVDMVLFV